MGHLLPIDRIARPKRPMPRARIRSNLCRQPYCTKKIGVRDYKCSYAPPGGLLRRILALPYELLLMFAVAMLIGACFPGAIEPHEMSSPRRHLFQGALLAALCAYFAICWRLGGHTLPMKTWKLRVVQQNGEQVSARGALLRSLLAVISFGSAGIGVAWALLDPDRQFLHDRLCHTRIVTTVS